MRWIVDRTTEGRSTHVDVVISPAMTASPVVTSVSHATHAVGSSPMMSSSTASEMASVTDSDVKRWTAGTVMVEELVVMNDGRNVRARRYRLVANNWGQTPLRQD